MKPAGRPATHRSPLIAPKKPAEGQTHIYLITSLHLVKIGIAGDLYLRLSNIRVDNPHSPELVKFWVLETEAAKRVDLLARDDLREHRACGDWFAVSMERAIASVEQMISLVLNRPSLCGTRG